MTTTFITQLAHLQKGRQPENRRWVYAAYDQLTDELSPLCELAPSEAALVLIESEAKGRRRPYHKQKLAWILCQQRNFALEQAARGVYVRYIITQQSYAETLTSLAAEIGALTVMRPAEYELRAELEPLFSRGLLVEVPHGGWLTRPDDLEQKSPYRMDAFYRHVRRRLGVLMDERGKPVGGRFSFDGDNRKPWPGTPAAPPLPRFERTELAQEIHDLLESRFADHPGTLDVDAIPKTKEEIERYWSWVKGHCLPVFGPFEDAMSTRSRNLFHTRISPLLNLHRLLPSRVVREALESDTDIASKEGFVRQVLGWREFVHHIHERTRGFRDLAPSEASPGDGGYSIWRGQPYNSAPTVEGLDGGASPNEQAQTAPVPPAFWGTPSGLHCLDHVVESVWEEGYSHHITRLMVLGNIATLLDVSPRQLTDWFWVAYIDAFDWVVEPNVLAMATYGSHEMTTKPYIAGSGYIARMSDYCGSCRFHPKKSCPLPRLYWAWLARHQDQLQGNRRMAIPLASLRKRTTESKAMDTRIFEHTSAALAAGQPVTPESVAESQSPLPLFNTESA